MPTVRRRRPNNRMFKLNAKSRIALGQVGANRFSLPANTVRELYRHRWQVGIFLYWIKQHLRIKAFFGTSLSAVQT